MVSLITVSKAQTLLAENIKAQRLKMELTQEGLASRAGVNLRTLRKFEQEGKISLESFLKLLMVLGELEAVVRATEPKQIEFTSIEDIDKAEKKKVRKKGWRK